MWKGKESRWRKRVRWKDGIEGGRWGKRWKDGIEGGSATKKVALAAKPALPYKVGQSNLLSISSPENIAFLHFLYFFWLRKVGE